MRATACARPTTPAGAACRSPRSASGKDWNEDLLIDMANRSGGTADYIDQPDKIIDYFQNTVQRAQATAIQNADLTLRLVQGVTPRAVWQVYPLISNLGYRPVSDRDVSVPLGELETGGGRRC